jgi:hypothetical protein
VTLTPDQLRVLLEAMTAIATPTTTTWEPAVTATIVDAIEAALHAPRTAGLTLRATKHTIDLTIQLADETGSRRPSEETPE